MSNPYAPPEAAVYDIADHHEENLPADRLERLGASMLDGLILGAMGMATGFVSALGRSNNGAAAGTMAIIVGGLGLVGFVAWCVLTIKYLRRNGQSIAKKLLGIKIVRTDGSPVSLARVFWLRNVVNGLLLGIIPLYGFIEVLFIFGESRQCLHDRIADTIVVKA